MNAHGLISATLSVYRLRMVLRTTLPQKEKKEIKIPSMDEIYLLAEKVKGTRVDNSQVRKIKISPYIKDLIEKQPKTSEYIVTYKRNSLYSRFTRLCEQCGLPRYRFHDLRHPNVKPATKYFLPNFKEIVAIMSIVASP